MKPSELLDLLKARTGVTSDYGVSKLLDASNQKVSGWRRDISFPDDESCIKIAHLIGENPATILISACIWRAKTKIAKESWEDALEKFDSPKKSH